MQSTEEQLGPYLPTQIELEEMKNEDFEAWVHQAKSELQKRAEQRDPLSQLRKRISKELGNPNLTGPQREARILREIERYEIIISSRL